MLHITCCGVLKAARSFGFTLSWMLGLAKPAWSLLPAAISTLGTCPDSPAQASLGPLRRDSAAFDVPMGNVVPMYECNARSTFISRRSDIPNFMLLQWPVAGLMPGGRPG